MDIGTVVMAAVSVILVGMLAGLFAWLTSGWIEPGVGLFFLGLAVIPLFFVFGWVLIIAIGVVCSLIAGMLFMGGE